MGGINEGTFAFEGGVCLLAAHWVCSGSQHL